MQGGIVWETSFLLATFLEAQFKRDKKGKRPRVLEVRPHFVHNWIVLSYIEEQTAWVGNIL